jgi:hypothetical protein
VIGIIWIRGGRVDRRMGLVINRRAWSAESQVRGRGGIDTFDGWKGGSGFGREGGGS